MSSLCTLADIVNEEEAELLNANTYVFSFIIEKIKLALKKADHQVLLLDCNWSAEELIRGKKCSNHDRNIILIWSRFDFEYTGDENNSNNTVIP